jgi:hypothetical protein
LITKYTQSPGLSTAQLLLICEKTWSVQLKLNLGEWGFPPFGQAKSLTLQYPFIHPNLKEVLKRKKAREDSRLYQLQSLFA